MTTIIVTVTVRADDGATKDITIPLTVNIPARATLLGVGGGNTNPTYLEDVAGIRLGLRRTYWRLPSDLSKAIAAMRLDHSYGRIPWASFKVGDWSSVINGSLDDTVKSLNEQVAALNQEVWVCFHHEPEGDGPVADFRAMQDRLLPMMTAPNVKTWIILTGWYQMPKPWGGGQSFEDYWPATAKPDGIGIDPYNWYGTDGKTTWDELARYYPATKAFADSKGVMWGIAEFGIDHDGTNNTAKDGAHWIQRAYDAANTAGCEGMAYFDTNLNNPANTDWRLSTLAAKQADFITALKTSKTPNAKSTT